jgi:hypothetical protein
MSSDQLRQCRIGVVALGAALGVIGCFTTPNIDVKTISCELPADCPAGYLCKYPGVPGGCCKSSDLTCGMGLDASASEAGIRSQADGAIAEQGQGQGLDGGHLDDGHVDNFEPDSSVSFGLDGSISTPEVPVVSDAAMADLGGEDQKSVPTLDLGSNLDMPLSATSDAENTVDSAPSINCIGLAAGTLCGDGMVCSNGLCVTCAAGGSCSVSTLCHKGILSCSTGTSVCVDNGNVEDGMACGTGNVCRSGACTACMAGQACPIANSPCRAGILTCSAGVSTCVDNGAKPDGTSCDDGNACTAGDTCSGGACTSGTPKTCPASGQCFAAGTCNPSTGACSSSPLSGVPCNDGDACTQTDTCQSGACVGSNPVVCTASDQCHTAGTCNSSTGTCSNPVANNGTSCNDGNACTQSDTCQGGGCSSGPPVICTALDQCHTAGACDPTTGVCSNPIQPNGTSCQDGNLCYGVYSCQGGACTGGAPVNCGDPGPCMSQAPCVPSTGTCPTPEIVNEGMNCSVGVYSGICMQGNCDW